MSSTSHCYLSPFSCMSIIIYIALYQCALYELVWSLGCEVLEPDSLGSNKAGSYNLKQRPLCSKTISLKLLLSRDLCLSKIKSCQFLYVRKMWQIEK